MNFIYVYFFFCVLELNCRCYMKGIYMIVENYFIENNSSFYNDVNLRT